MNYQKTLSIAAVVFFAIFLSGSQLFAQPEVKESQLLSKFDKLSNAAFGETAVKSVDLETVNAIYKSTLSNPVSKLEVLEKYDPTGIIGFCFGRAMTAHLTARDFRIEPKSIFKLFLVGDLRSNGSKPEWRFHVTTVVPMKDGAKLIWMAIDPIMKKPITVAQWIQEVRTGWDSWHADEKHHAKLYLVKNDAVMPDIRSFPEVETGKYLIELKFNPEANGIKKSVKWANAFDVDDQIYAPTSVKVDKFFLVTKSNSRNQFSFLGLKINTDDISYNNYFVDLLATFTQPTSEDTNLESVNKMRSLHPTGYRPMGFQLHRLVDPSFGD
ncbi:MAG: protein-glutamine glutaminase family protein [Pseudomonadota bacterium]|nr:protein-glutamine glutaminase family protein [Pseudomonadota bacterium]